MPSSDSPPAAEDSTLPAWGHRLSRTVGLQIRHHRQMAGMTVVALAEATREMGHSVPRQSITALESGHREGVTLPEIFVLSAALGVAPGHLMLPIGTAATVEVLPGVDARTDAAWEWLALGWAPEGVPAVSEASRRVLTRVTTHAAIVSGLVAGMAALDEEAPPDRAEALAEMDRSRTDLLVRRAVMAEAGEVPPDLPEGMTLTPTESGPAGPPLAYRRLFGDRS